MLGLLWLIPVLPLVGFLGLILAGSRMSRRAIALIGVGSVGLSALVATLVAVRFISAPPPGHVYAQVLWQWMAVGSLTPRIAFHLDALSLVMLLVVTVVGFLIHLYAAEFMGEEEGYSRFFAYMNLFVAAMTVLVLADDLLLLYVGWEGVGLCSYLLIGFWYRDPANGRAAQKAFIVTRIGDTALAVGLLLLFTDLGTLDIQAVVQRASQTWPVGSASAVAAATLLLGGALGKSAQLPLHTWLPDAMAGPTPVSALIHAATMVTAGVYLIARTHGLFTLAPQVLSAVAVVGALTMLFAGCSALTQRDIKRVLAYSTMSQVGLMFLALGAGAWPAAIFHVVTHAFFKALLFLAAGVVILGSHHEQDVFRMGGVHRRMPLAFSTFLIGAASLAGLPLVTAGFFSKERILGQAWAGAAGGRWLWAAGVIGALLTSLYIFRVVFYMLRGSATTAVPYRAGMPMRLALLTLAVLAVAGGYLEVPRTLGDLTLSSDFIRTALPTGNVPHADVRTELTLQSLVALASLLGIALAYLLFMRRPGLAAALTRTSVGADVYRWWSAGWGFDRLYERFVVEPFTWLALANRDDVLDAVASRPARLSRLAHGLLGETQNGNVRWYAAGIAAGSIVFVAMAVFL